MIKKSLLLATAAILVPYTSWASEGDLTKIGKLTNYRTEYEDTFIHLARDYDLGFVEMRAANPGVDPWVPGAGTRLVLPTEHLLPDAPQEGVVINIPEMRIYYYEKEGEEPKTFPIGIGREGLETPRGETKVVRKAEGPTWRPTPRMLKEDPKLEPVVPPGPDNPLGTHALYLGWPQYLIHGTNKPFGIGRKISSGCIRMYPEDITQFFEMVPVGTKVTVVDQPVKMGWVDDVLYLEANPTEEQTIEVEERGVLSYDEVPKDELDRFVKFIGDDYEEIDWEAVRKVYGLRLGYPIPVGKRKSAQEKAEAEKNPDPKDVKLSSGEIKEMAMAKLQAIYDRESENMQQEAVKSASRFKPSQSSRRLNP